MTNSNHPNALNSLVFWGIKAIAIPHTLLTGLLTISLIAVIFFGDGPSSIPWSHYGLWLLMFINNCMLAYFYLKLTNQLPSQQEETEKT